MSVSTENKDHEKLDKDRSSFISWLDEYRIENYFSNKTLKGIRELNELSIKSDVITEIPESISSFTCLKKLTISCDRLVELPSSIRNLSNLEVLELYNIKNLLSLPEWIGELIKLEVLRLGGGYNDSHLPIIPNTYKNILTLKKLEINYSGDIDVPKWIGNLVNLDTLILNSKGAINLPSSIGDLKLKSLCINSTIETLPKWIGDIVSLNKLSTSSIPPDSIKYLVNLKEVHFYSVNKFPSTMRFLHNIESLTFEGLNEIPNWIGDLTSLIELIVIRGDISKLPRSIGKLVNLKVLSLARCFELRELPDTIGNLTNLETLHSDSNRLLIVPDSIANLKFIPCEIKLNMQKIKFDNIIKDNINWQNACRINTKESYEEYLYNYKPTGLHEKEAKININLINSGGET